MYNPNYKSTAELMALGWQFWDERLILCPLSEFENIRDGVVFMSINGKQAIKGGDKIDQDTRFGVDKIDLDTRFGMLAYGIRRRMPK